jgi:2-C-methyl-D-erythritol 4-phosphate cytidylyltransferase/2-C-methyl-D-erythritol 2,4-cyclodiphosphate synthase
VASGAKSWVCLKNRQHIGNCPRRGKRLPARDAQLPRLSPNTAAVVVAAGAGLRAWQPLPKQYTRWRGKPVVRHSVEALACAGIAPIVVVIADGAEELARAALAGLDVRLVTGGATRQQSVRNGLEALAPDARPRS